MPTQYAANQKTLDELKASIDLRDIVTETWGPGRRYGDSVRWPARWRGGNNKTSFAVNATHYTDYASSDNGDTFSFLMREHNLSFAEAVEWVRARVEGGSIRVSSRPDGHAHQSTSKSEPPPAAWQQPTLATLEACERYLWSGKPDANKVLDYLRDKRGLSDDTIRSKRYGYNPSWMQTDYRDDSGKRAGLAPGIVIPRFADGALWMLNVRRRVGDLAETLGISPERDRDGDEVSKYTSLKGSKPKTFYNADALALGRPFVLIVEGEFDAALAEQELDASVAVVTLGSASGTLPRRWRDRLAPAEQVYLALDGDEAGQEATARLAEQLPGKHRALKLPMGKDITEYVVEHGGDLRAWWEAAQQPPVAARWFADGVPTSWQRALLKHAEHALLPYEALTEGLRHGLLDPDELSIPALLKCNDELDMGVSPSAIRRGFPSLVGIFFADLHTEKDPNTVCKLEKNSPAGRKAITYRLLALDEAKANLLEIAAAGIMAERHPIEDKLDNPAVVATLSKRAVEALGVEEEAEVLAAELDELSKPAYEVQRQERFKAGKRARRDYDRLKAALANPRRVPLPDGWPIRNIMELRIALLRAWKLDQPDELRSRRDIAAALGISARAVDSYLERAGIEVEGDQTVKAPITSSVSVERQVRQIACTVKGKPLCFISETADGHTVAERYSTDAARQFVPQQLAVGATVFVKLQVANRHAVIDMLPPEPEVKQPRPPRDWGETDTEVPATPKVIPLEQPREMLGYDPRWVRGQLTLRLRVMGWIHNGQFMNSSTGEVAPFNATAAELLSLMVGREVKTIAQVVDAGAIVDLLNFASVELGATVRRVLVGEA